MSKEKKIPKKKIEEGKILSLRKAEQHLDCAELLIRNNFLDNAVDIIEFAIEEFGRAVYLKERLEKGLETIEDTIERSHWLKYDKAFSVLPEKLKTIWESTINPLFPTNYFPKGYFPTARGTISPYTRLNAIFTDYNEETQTWQSGTQANGEKLMEIVSNLRKYIGDFQDP